MGVHANIAFDKFPAQGEWLGKTVTVCFHYDTSRFLQGKIVRDDREAPHCTLIQLEDGRVVSTEECQYRPPREDCKQQADPVEWPNVIDG